jgi:hypothetical protein
MQHGISVKAVGGWHNTTIGDCRSKSELNLPGRLPGRRRVPALQRRKE